jgi:hypothetical protein
MRNLLLSALLLASAFQTALGETWGDYGYSVNNDKATITSYIGAGGSVTIPDTINGLPVTIIDNNVFAWRADIKQVILPSGIKSINQLAFMNTGLTWIIVPTDDVAIANSAFSGTSCTIITPSLLNAFANNDTFVAAVANKIKGTEGNYGIATQGLVSNVAGNLATKTELTSSLTQSRTDGINSVLSNPNLWTLYTTSQIQNMAVGDLVLTRQVSGSFVLNYDIEQSTDLQTWTPYQALSLPLTGLPTDKAFVRIKAKQ